MLKEIRFGIEIETIGSTREKVARTIQSTPIFIMIIVVTDRWG